MNKIFLNKVFEWFYSDRGIFGVYFEKHLKLKVIAVLHRFFLSFLNKFLWFLNKPNSGGKNEFDK